MTALTRQAFGESIRLLRTRRFGTFVFASLLSNIGTWAQQVAQPWLLLSLGASSFLVGLDAFAQGAPAWMLTIAGGMLADHLDRRRVIVVFQSIQMMCPVLLVVLLLTGTVHPWMVILISLTVGVTDALSMPSFQSIVPSIVTRDQIGTALALNSTQFNLSRILGPALAAVLMATVGAVGCFAVNAASYIPFLMVAVWILPKARLRDVNGGAEPAMHLLDGIRRVAGEPQLRGAVTAVFATSLLCGPLITFCPILIRDAFHGTANQFSATIGAFGTGGLIGAVLLLFLDPSADRRRWTISFAATYGVVLILVAENPLFAALPALLMLAGLSMSVSNTSANTLAQSIAPHALRGQTVSLYMLGVRGGTSLGSLLTGLLVGWLGIRHALLVNGVAAVFVQVAMTQMWKRPPIAASLSSPGID